MAQFDQSFTLEGTVTFANAGVNKRGDAYYMVKVSGFTFFVERDVYVQCKQGDRVQIMGSCTGTRPGSYDPQFEIDGILPLKAELQFDPAIKRVEKGAPPLPVPAGVNGTH